MPLVLLYTDFGATDLYVGQLKTVLAGIAPKLTVIDALHDAPDYDISASAHLLAALAPQYPAGSVFVAVVDPGVGGERDAIVVDADGRSLVGPDNGLLSVLWQRAKRRRCRRIVWRPERLSTSFHARDLFAPVAAKLAAKRLPRGWLAPKPAPEALLDAGDLGEVIYVDHYGNAMTGIRAHSVSRDARLRVSRRSLRYANTFDSVRPGEVFWYENSLGLVEIAANRASAARRLALRIGARVRMR
jgi:S-adenosylmethionine hydrolase